MNDSKASAFGVVLSFYIFSPFLMKQTPKRLRQKNHTQNNMIRKEIRLLPQQVKTLQIGAKNHQMALSRFIPQAALAYCNEVFITPDKDQIQQVCLSCREVSNALYKIAYKNDPLHTETLQNINDMVAVLEQSLLHILHHPPRLRDILRQAFKDPKLRQWLVNQQTILMSHSA